MRLTKKLLLLLSLFTAVYASSQDSVKLKKISVLPVPAFGYSPETKTYVGAVCLFTFDFFKDTLTRKSNAKLEFNYTWNKQIVLESGWNFFTKEEKYFTKGLVHYSKFPDFYYGIGSETPDSNKLAFTSERFIVDLVLLKKIKAYLFTGFSLKYIQFGNVAPLNSNGMIYPELASNSNFGLGYSILKDNRNSILSPTTGKYLYVNASYNFSRTNFFEFFFDSRLYKTWKNKYTLAGRFVTDMNSKQAPFYEQAFLGGDKYVRGYYFGRFRDQHLSTLQLEFRMPLFWRFGLASFGGLSNLFPSFSDFNLTKTKFNAGLGLRFLVDKKDKTNLRIDYAVGNKHNSGFYISFGESF